MATSMIFETPRGLAEWEWHSKDSQATFIGVPRSRRPSSGASSFSSSSSVLEGAPQGASVFASPEAYGKPLRHAADADAATCGFKRPRSRLLGLLPAAAICANDVTGSIYYSAGPLIQVAGLWAPLCYVLVSCVLGLFINIYTEVVTALPLNGGGYSAFVNLAPKRLALVVSVLSVISYIATVCTNAATAVSFLLQGLELSVDGAWANVGLEAVPVVLMCLLMVLGIRESAAVSTGIFCLHVVTEATMVVVALYIGASTGWSNLSQVWAAGAGNPNPWGYSLAFGWANAFLGVTGFETSANFVEEQRSGVFPGTLKIMWLISAVANPLLVLAAFVVVPPAVLVDPSASSAMLLQLGVHAAERVGGNWLKNLIIVDSVCILVGTVLTGFVGVTGLFARLEQDRCIPHWFARRSCTGANLPIPIVFCALCVALMALTGGDVTGFNDTYTMAFLVVMSLFGAANLLLKHTRNDLRQARSLAKQPWGLVLLAIACTLTCLVLTVLSNPVVLRYFFTYFVTFVVALALYSERAAVLRAVARLCEPHVLEGEAAAAAQGWLSAKLHCWAVRQLREMDQEAVVFLSRRLDIRDINRAVEYVLANETSRVLKVVHGLKTTHELPATVMRDLETLRRAHPQIQIDLLCLELHGDFGPGFVSAASDITGVKPCRMFIASPSRRFSHDIAELGSVRVIMRRNDRGMLTQDVTKRLALVSAAASSTRSQKQQQQPPPPQDKHKQREDAEAAPQEHSAHSTGDELSAHCTDGEVSVPISNA